MEETTAQASSTGIGMAELLAQFGAASAFAGILVTLLWRVIRQAREERAEMLKMMSEDNQRSVEAINGLKDVMNDLSLGLKWTMKDIERRNRE